MDPLSRDQVYTQSTLWSQTPYTNLDALKESGEATYIVMSSIPSGKTSPTFGKLSIVGISYDDYCTKVNQWGQASGEPIASFETTGYGTIKVWAIGPRVNSGVKK